MLSFIEPKKSASTQVSKLQLSRFAHLESGRVHLKAVGTQTKPFKLDYGQSLTRSYCQKAPPLSVNLNTF